jgi:hypothetical protein
MRGREWSTSELRLLQDNMNLTDRRLGQILDRSPNAILKARKRFGLHKGKSYYKNRPKLDQMDREAIRASEMSSHYLAQEFGISHTTILRYRT